MRLRESVVCRGRANIWVLERNDGTEVSCRRITRLPSMPKLVPSTPTPKSSPSIAQSGPRIHQTQSTNSRVNETLNNGHTSLGELLLGVTASSVGNVDGVVDVDVVGQRDVLDFDTARGLVCCFGVVIDLALIALIANDSTTRFSFPLPGSDTFTVHARSATADAHVVLLSSR